MFTGAGWPMWQVWLLYLLLGAITLALLYYPMRKFSHWLHLILLSPVAAMMFTPLSIEPESPHWAPSLLVMIFEMEKGGVESFGRGFYPILLLWLALLALGSAWLIKKKQSSTNAQADA